MEPGVFWSYSRGSFALFADIIEDTICYLKAILLMINPYEIKYESICQAITNSNDTENS